MRGHFNFYRYCVRTISKSPSASNLLSVFLTLGKPAIYETVWRSVLTSVQFLDRVTAKTNVLTDAQAGGHTVPPSYQGNDNGIMLASATP